MKYSIIIPAYNVEKYIEKCIISILNQTYPVFELIIINDGSTDKTESICEKYTKIDRRVFLYNRKNEGVSSARNFGINVSSRRKNFICRCR